MRRISLSLVSLAVLALLALGAARLTGGHAEQGGEKAREAAATCPEAAKGEAGAGEEAKAEEARAQEAKAEGDGAGRRAGSATAALFSGPADSPQAECGGAGGHPESFADLAKANSSR
ncbi:MAG: hypothetical protein QOF26_3827, partial [Baekduia sp.]|nr:hypothetical protein [Baekduia sp.]